MKKEYEYIRFDLLRQTAKTFVYNIVNRKHGTILGTIGWYGPWRQYCIFPAPNMVFSLGCWKDILEFTENLKKQRNGTVNKNG
jgi:hypothetical protein